MHVSLSGAVFLPTGSSAFGGTVSPSGEIRFIIRPEMPWDYDAFDLVERLSDGSSLIVSGSIVARSTPAGISGSRNPIGDSLEIRLNPLGGWCPIERFDMTPR